ncbi:MAG TPA: SDR family NAD(P)-dependent oxidoreductase [Candidatus Babeliales bacterium]|nr:SDR family NAD(P)-dependent oxidoreductase [Candidatus Babeliales bacterium]
MLDAARTLIVTGASSGIGRALALAAASASYRVAIVARNAERLAEVAEQIRGTGGSCVVIPGDVTAADVPARIVDVTVREFGRIDVLVNNAGLGAYGALLEQSDAAIEAQWKLHVMAPLRITRAALAHLETSRGQVVFLGSGIARVPLPNYGAYALAKAAVRAAAIQLRRELRARGVAVTYVDPGLVATEFHSRIGIERSMPFAASPQTVANAILRGIARRSAVVSAVPWQTAFTAMGEWFGTLADPMIVKLRAKRSAAPETQQQGVILSGASAACHPERSAAGAQSKDEGRQSKDDFETALEPVTRRMERVNLSADFLRTALVPGAALELNELAMRWAGMPNKNERAALREALEALAAGGYLQPAAEETWKVLRAAD